MRSRAARTPRGSPPTPARARRRSPSCARSTRGCTARSKSCPRASGPRRVPIHPRPAWGAAISSASWAAARSRSCCRRGSGLRLLGAVGAAPRAAGAAAGRGAASRPPCRYPGRCATRGSRSRCARPRSRSLPGPKTRMWTYDGTFPGPTIRRPAGERTEVTFKHRLPARGRRAHRPPARRPQPQRVRRPAGRPDPLAPALLLLPDPRGTAGAALRQRPADRAGLREDLRLRPARGRPARTRRLPVVPRPSPRPHRPQRLARPGRDVDRRRRARRLAGAAARRAATCR